MPQERLERGITLDLEDFSPQVYNLLWRCRSSSSKDEIPHKVGRRQTDTLARRAHGGRKNASVLAVTYGALRLRVQKTEVGHRPSAR